MDNTIKPDQSADRPRPPRPDLDAWNGDIQKRPPAWRRRPRSRSAIEFAAATRPVVTARASEPRWDI